MEPEVPAGICAFFTGPGTHGSRDGLGPARSLDAQGLGYDCGGFLVIEVRQGGTVFPIIARTGRQMKRISEPLGLGLRRLLARSVECDSELDDVESSINCAQRRFRFWYTWFLVTGGLGLVVFYVGFFVFVFSSSRGAAAPTLIVGACMIVLGGFLAFINRPTWALYLSFRDLYITIALTDSALGTALASNERRNLAEWLALCASRIRSFGPRNPLILHKMIVKQQAVRASRVLRYLVYPAMLGSDQELEAIKSALVEAVLKIGTSNWVRIGELTVNVGEYPPVKTSLQLRPSMDLALIFFTALAAIPAIPILVSFFG